MLERLRNPELRSKKYCTCRTVYDPLRFMIQCGCCSEWFHGDCLSPKITEHDSDGIEVFHCARCEAFAGPSVYLNIRKSTRDKATFDYSTEFGIDHLHWTKLLQKKHFKSADFMQLPGDQVTLEWARSTGFREPVLVARPDGLQMQMPKPDITVPEIADLVG